MSLCLGGIIWNILCENSFKINKKFHGLMGMANDRLKDPACVHKELWEACVP